MCVYVYMISCVSLLCNYAKKRKIALYAIKRSKYAEHSSTTAYFNFH